MTGDSQAFLLDAMRNMLAEFIRDDGPSESGSAEGSDAVEESPAGAGRTAVRETILGDRGLRNFGETGHGEAAVPVEVSPERGQPDQPRKAVEMGAYPSEVEVRGNEPGILRQHRPRRRKGGRRGKNERGGRGTNEVGDGSAAAAGGDGISAKAAEGSVLVRGCYMCGKQGHISAN